MTTNRRDRLRELLDSVLDERHDTLDDMAEDVHSSRFHFARTISRSAGESPMAMRRRVMLERAAWQLQCGASVTDAAWTAGYESAEGFSRAFVRAFGHPPSRQTSGHWLPSPNGIHFHPPTSLWVHAQESPMNPLAEQLVRHDLDDTAHLIGVASALGDEELRTPHLPGNVVLEWDGEEASISAVLESIVFSKEVWLASIEGLDTPERGDPTDVEGLRARHELAAARWLAAIRDIDRGGAWDDRLVDALCDPPESFVLSAVAAHVLTFSAHRRQLVRQMMRAGGHRVDDGDPIIWLRRLRGEHDEQDEQDQHQHQHASEQRPEGGAS